MNINMMIPPFKSGDKPCNYDYLYLRYSSLELHPEVLLSPGEVSLPFGASRRIDRREVPLVAGCLKNLPDQ